MNLYFIIAKYLAVAAAGAALAVLVYATPRISALKADAAKAQAEAAQEKATFLKGASDEQARLQGLVDAANRAADDSRVARDNAAHALAVVSSKLRDRIASTVASDNCRLSQAGSGSQGDAPAAALGVLATNLDDFGKRCAAESDRLSDAVRRLEASR